ncbi:MAG: PKD domain-containing protein [Paludibacteraceae bacterium]
MKKQLKALLLVAFFACTTLPAWSQASTQGKEFWVSSSLVCSPDKATPAPYIAVSAEKACTVKIQGGTGNAINITQQVGAGSWTEFGNGTASQLDPSVGPVKVPMDASKWYPTNISDANNVSSLAGKKNMYGLHITATEKISVYVILSSTHSMDASNILPINALGCEYYTQDYWSKVKSGFDNAVGLTTILGTEDNTTIDITPNGDTFDGWTSGSTHQITLNKGQTYYLVTKKADRLAGTHILSRGGKKIAVYCGVPITNVPTGIAARDCLFEQPMPIEYWGTQFIATRSLEKNGNLIGITATTNGTEIKVDGYAQAIINAGETYYIMLQGASDPNGKAPGESPIDLVVTADAMYVETSCPCAVFNYDTGNSYKGKDTDEVVGGKGDPSSVWVSPVQQKINRITFGTCYTDKTKDHFLNIVTETATCQETKLTALFGINAKDKTDLLTWIPVDGNPKYSYARAKIGDAGTKDYSVFRLENPKGFIATVYGNGEDESYAYSAGSAAVEQGINVNEITFVNGFKDYDNKFCFNQDIEFNANGVGTDEVSRVDWNFGDGITQTNGDPLTTHKYTSPGWYDVTANLYGHQVCTDESEQFLGSVSFSFRVVRADTVIVDPGHYCFSPEEYAADKAGCDKLIAEGKNDTLWDQRVNCYDTVKIQRVVYGIDTEYEYDAEGRDSALVNGQWYYSSQDVQHTIPNKKGCDSIITCHLKVITCLGLSFNNDSANQHACYGESLALPYVKTKGDIGKVRFVIPGVLDEEVEMDNANTESGTLEVPTNIITKPGKYVAQLQVEDAWCDPLTYNFDIAVYYPSDVFAYKFNNVLAVYKPGKGGNKGWNFNAYQWYRNGEPITGATESVYHLDGIFAVNDEVYVVLTDNEGMQLPSCPITIETVPDFNSQAAVQKRLVNQQMVIQHGNRIYNLYGQRIQ